MIDHYYISDGYYKDHNTYSVFPFKISLYKIDHFQCAVNIYFFLRKKL